MNPRQMRIFSRYLAALNAMRQDGEPVPPEVLREYLDEERAIRHTRPGLHEKVVIINRKSSPEMITLVRNKTVEECGVRIEVRG